MTTLQTVLPGIRIPTEGRSFCLLQRVQTGSAATHSPIQWSLRPHTLQFNQICGHTLANSISSAATRSPIQSALRPHTRQFNQLCGHTLTNSISSAATHSPIQSALRPHTHQFSQLWGSFLEVRLPEREVDCSFPSIAKIKNEWSYTSTPFPHVRLHCVYTDSCTSTLKSYWLGLRLIIISGHWHGVRGGWYT